MQNGLKLVYGTGNRCLMETKGEESFKVLDCAWKSGFRIFDTAHSYGNAEENLGMWMNSRKVRDKLTIIDKGCNPGQKGSDDILSADTIKDQLGQSMERLKTDHIDYYILHRDDPSKPVDDIIEVLNECKQKGWIDRFGASNWSFQRIQKANSYADSHGMEGFTAVSPTSEEHMLEAVNAPTIEMSEAQARWLECDEQ